MAGSERIPKTSANSARFQESIKISISVTCLGRVVCNLTEAKSTHVPYRDSKLTRLLQDSLGGHCKTVLIANLSPSERAEGISTLRFASRARGIKNKPRVNLNPASSLIK